KSLSRTAGSRVEVVLLAQEELGPDPAGLHAGQGLGREVVVVEVLVRDHTDRAEPGGTEETTFLERQETPLVSEEPGEQVPAAVQHAPQPAEMIDPEVVEPEIVRVPIERGRHAPAEGLRRVADPDRAVA